MNELSLQIFLLVCREVQKPFSDNRTVAKHMRNKSVFAIFPWLALKFRVEKN